MTNWKKYTNIPYKEFGRDFNGVDCYGLIALIYKEEKNIIIPDYTELAYNKTRYDIKNQEDHILKSIGIAWVFENKPKTFDVLIFNKGSNCKITSHIGLYMGNNKFIHVLENFPSYIERLNNPLWKSRLYGVMRFNG